MRKAMVIWAGAAMLLGSVLTGCAASSGGKSDDGTDGADATAANDSADATDSTTGVDVADAVDAVDSVDGTDVADATDSTDTFDSTDATDATDSGECVPYCLPAWECGSNGCPDGTCGAGCGDGEICDAQARVCKKAPEPPKEYGAPCGITDTCNPDATDWPACLNAQCDSGICRTIPFGNVCTKACAIKADETDAQGNKKSDGIEDPDAPASDCEGAAANSPYGQDWACVQIGDPAAGGNQQLCQPGTTFGVCKTDADCPSTEACQLTYLNGNYETRCGARRQGSVEAGFPCNDDPAAGEVAYCASELCLRSGCTSFCTDAAQCAEFQQCEQDAQIFGDAPDLVFDYCVGKLCDDNGQCTSDSYCGFGGNGETGDAFELESSCFAGVKDGSGLGGPCDGDTSDGDQGPACNGIFCLTTDICTSLCNGDSGCEGGATDMFCIATEEWADWVEGETIDFDADNSIEGEDTPLTYGFCVSYEGSKSSCEKDGDCTAGEACEFNQVFNEDGTLNGVGYCVKPDAEGAALGEACGGDTGIRCKSGFCMTVSDAGGICTPVCSSTDDCPQGVAKDPNDPTSKGLSEFCQSYLWSFGGTIENDKDIVWVPICTPYSGEESFEDCSGDYTCTEATESCLSSFVAMGTDKAKVEYRCAESTGTAKLGGACSNAEGATDAQQCEDFLCVATGTGDDGYCSKFCNDTEDCAGGTPDMVCDESDYFENGKGDKLTRKMCRKAKSCLPCGDNSQCTDGFLCANIGGSGLNADLRCVPACENDGECESKDGGDKCIATKDEDGKATTDKGCVPTSCD